MRMKRDATPIVWPSSFFMIQMHLRIRCRRITFSPDPHVKDYLPDDARIIRSCTLVVTHSWIDMLSHVGYTLYTVAGIDLLFSLHPAVCMLRNLIDWYVRSREYVRVCARIDWLSFQWYGSLPIDCLVSLFRWWWYRDPEKTTQSGRRRKSVSIFAFFRKEKRTKWIGWRMMFSPLLISWICSLLFIPLVYPLLSLLPSLLSDFEWRIAVKRARIKQNHVSSLSEFTERFTGCVCLCFLFYPFVCAVVCVGTPCKELPAILFCSSWQPKRMYDSQRDKSSR